MHPSRMVPTAPVTLRPATAEDTAAIVRLNALEVPLVSNAKARVVRSGRQAGRLLARQLTNPVHWTSCVERLRELGTTSYVELGPGKVLEGLIRRIDPRAVIAIAATPDEVRALAESARA